MNLFENVSGARAKDCYIDTKIDRIIFVVDPGNIGLAIGRNGKNIKHIRNLMGKDVDVVEYHENVENFVKNCLSPAKVDSVTTTKKRDGKKVVNVVVGHKDRGLAIGKNGKSIDKARILAQRHFGIDNIVID